MSSPLSAAVFHSEKAYDALLDAMPLAGRIIQSPCTEEELLREFSDLDRPSLVKMLSRLVRGDIVRKVGDKYEATSTFLYSYRQGTQLEAVSELFLPMVLGVAEDPGDGLLLHLELALSVEEQLDLFSGPVKGLLANLSALGDQPAKETHERCLFVLGTPDVPVPQTGLDRILEILRRSARDRVDPARRDRSILTFFQGRFATTQLATRAVLDFESQFASKKANTENMTYSLVVGLGRRPSSGGAKE